MDRLHDEWDFITWFWYRTIQKKNGFSKTLCVSLNESHVDCCSEKELEWMQFDKCTKIIKKKIVEESILFIFSHLFINTKP